MSLEKGEGIHILSLLSNPWNLFHTKWGERPVKGAGSSLVFQAIRPCIELEKPYVHLKARPLAVGFYEKLGFELNPQPEDTVCPSMILTAEKIWQLYPHFIIPNLAA